MHVLRIKKLLVWLSLQSFQLHREGKLKRNVWFYLKIVCFFSFAWFFISFTSVVFFILLCKRKYSFRVCLPIPYLIPIYDYLYVLKLTRNFLKSAVSLTHTQNTDSDALLLIVSHCFFYPPYFNFCSCHYYVTNICMVYVRHMEMFNVIKSICCIRYYFKLIIAVTRMLYVPIWYIRSRVDLLISILYLCLQFVISFVRISNSFAMNAISNIFMY